VTRSDGEHTHSRLWFRELAIVAIAVLLGVSAFVTAILFVSQSPWMAVGTLIGSAALGYAGYRSLMPAGDQKLWMIAVLWTLTTLAMIAILSLAR
jgi:hypothetical protein